MNEDIRRAYEAGQRDMRQRCIVVTRRECGCEHAVRCTSIRPFDGHGPQDHYWVQRRDNPKLWCCQTPECPAILEQG